MWKIRHSWIEKTVYFGILYEILEASAEFSTFIFVKIKNKIQVPNFNLNLKEIIL